MNVTITDEFRKDFLSGMTNEQLSKKYNIPQWRIIRYYTCQFSEDEKNQRKSIISHNINAIRYEDTLFIPPDKDEFNKELLCYSITDLVKKYNSTKSRVLCYCKTQVPKEIWEEHRRIANKITINKSQKTKLEKYGDKNYHNPEKAKQTCLEKYGVEYSTQTQSMKDKTKKTCLERYGVENAHQSDEIKERTKQTCLEKYGVTNPMRSDECRKKARQTCLEKYGVEFYTQTEEQLQKRAQTCLERYGNSTYVGSDKFYENINQIQEKRHNTLRTNGTFNTSKPEEDLYNELCNIFSKDDVVRQYKCDRYPWHCDFYIKSKDLFIEYQGNWTHGGMPFDKDNDLCIEQLNKWKMKSDTGKYYRKAIYVWTELDVLKRTTAKNNQLNYVELWKGDYFYG